MDTRSQRIRARQRPLALAPWQIQNIKRHKGRIPISIGGSTRGTTLAFGDWDIRIKGVGVKFTAKQQCLNIRVVKGAKVHLRDSAYMGNETRIGKGKGTFALRQAADKLPTTFEFITRQSFPRLGSMVVQPSSSPASTTSTATPSYIIS
ncbi:hypothetical protein F5141DRAFT_1189729 [Pisolithus sp. B1]|nr:hypothetical protein F5141DRAFT_1189729 [Pisolithus sp. B1]